MSRKRKMCSCASINKRVKWVKKKIILSTDNILITNEANI